LSRFSFGPGFFSKLVRNRISLYDKNMPATLITGASGGLGEEFARLAAADGKNLVLVARRKDKLEQLAEELKKQHGISVVVLAHDLSAPGAAAAIVAELGTQSIVVRELINNAGFGGLGLFHELSLAEQKQMIDLNIGALTELTRLLLPAMITRGEGGILNVASTAAFQPGPLMAVYYATKAYVMNFSLALSEELRGTGVSVTCLCPGPTHTGFQAHANMMKSRLFSLGSMQSHPVAEAGYRAFKNKKALIVTGARNRFAVFCTRFIPRLWAARVARSIQAPT
jgi:short-subunit dehydrogenase